MQNLTRSRFTGLSVPEILELGREIAKNVETEIYKVVYGPELRGLIDLLIVAAFAKSGHVLARAPVGLAKTLTMTAMAMTIGGVFKKRQFRPDMLPSELSGFEVWNPKTQQWDVRHGIFHKSNFVLADEINRGTPKTQSALLEAMEEGRVTIGNEEYQLEPMLQVMATRNPMEHEGTYQLPEAQLDRFFAQKFIDGISKDTLVAILSDPDIERPSKERLERRVKQVTTPAEILQIREAIIAGIYVDPLLIDYIARLVLATGEHNLVEYGSSPRGAISLKIAAKIIAFREGRDYALPQDVQRHAVDILAHRIFLEPQTRDDPDRAMTPADIIKEILTQVEPAESSYDKRN